MKNNDPNAWLNQVLEFVGEYTSLNPGYSPRALSENLMRKFLISFEDAEKIRALVEKELPLDKLGLAAIELNLTFNCNLTCEYCFVQRKSPEDRMTFDTARRAIDFLMEHATFPSVIITLIGGEPLLEFALIKRIVPYAKEAGEKHNREVTWALTTNGTLVDESMLKYFAQNQINMLISIDGGPDTHNRYRKTRSGEGTWHKIANLIPLIKRYQPWLGARMTVSTEAIENMQEDFRQIINLGINQMIIAPAQGGKVWTTEQITQYGLNLMEITKDYHQLKQQGLQISIEEFEKSESDFTGWGCRAGSTSLAVAPNGDVSPCSKLLGLTNEAGRYIVGNVNTGVQLDLLTPFKNPLGQQPGHCKRCSRPCAGGCYSVNFEQTGDFFTPSEENCLFWVVCQESKRLSGMI